MYSHHTLTSLANSILPVYSANECRRDSPPAYSAVPDADSAADAGGIQIAQNLLPQAPLVTNAPSHRDLCAKMSDVRLYDEPATLRKRRSGEISSAAGANSSANSVAKKQNESGSAVSEMETSRKRQKSVTNAAVPTSSSRHLSRWTHRGRQSDPPVAPHKVSVSYAPVAAQILPSSTVADGKAIKSMKAQPVAPLAPNAVSDFEQWLDQPPLQNLRPGHRLERLCWSFQCPLGAL